jgi:MEMO1 family protein
MGRIKGRMLPAGWYPDDPDTAEKALRGWLGCSKERTTGGVACVVPHAGWDFSGELAFSVLRCLARPVDTIVVVGGHLPPNAVFLVCAADRFETPFGYLETDHDVLARLCKDLDFEEDIRADNTVEIQLPLIKFLFPETKIISLRVSPSADAIELGKKLHALSVDLHRSMAVVGSTDLTHYGPSYGFSPAGTGRAAVDWVKEENDKPFLQLLLKMDGEAAMDHAEAHGSACSSGAAAVAAAFAATGGVTDGTLVGYRMSCDLILAESFVGYGGIVFVP